MQIPRDHIILGLIALTLTFLLAGGFMVLYVMLYNTRKRKHLQEKEWMQQRFVQELALTKMEVQDQTLQTIASDIHDNVGQLLSITRITLSSIDPNNLSGKAEEKLNGAISLLENSIKELRQLAALLHAPNRLADGLERAIENELQWISRAGKYKVCRTVNGPRSNRIDPESQLIAFRIVQELLNNIIKHADATTINLEMNYGEHAVSIKLSDNGKGFDLKDVLDKPKGLGIGNFYNRSAMINGSFNLSSIPGSGTTAILEFPYQQS